MTSDKAYTPLSDNSIRLLNILPGEPNSEIHCQLTEAPLTEGTQYTALSYTWGYKPSRPSDHEIRIDSSRFSVNKNLWRFLSHARRLNFAIDGPFWIDAICIDQENNDERTQQVQLMPQIYSTAREVLVWLGPGYAWSELAMKVFAKAAPTPVPNSTFWKILSGPTGLAISLLCHRPYWTRLWIFPEVTVARRIILMCGDQTIPWEPFRSFLHKVLTINPTSRQRENVQYRNISASPAAAIVKQTTESLSDVTLWNMMSATQHLRCSEPRDKIYALLGIIGKGHDGIRPDYTLGIPSLLNTVLRNAHALKAPKNLEEVTHQCWELATWLGQESNALFVMEAQDGHQDIPSKEDVNAFPFIARRTPVNLWWAAFYGHDDIIPLLFNSREIDPPLSIEAAVRAENVAAATLILSTRKIGVRTKGALGVPELLWWAEHGYETMVRTLLSVNDIDVNWQDASGYTALHHAALRAQHCIVELLLDREDVDIGVKTEKGETALMFAVDELRSRETMGSRQVIVKLLLDADERCRHFDINERRWALILAEEGGARAIVELLLEKTPGLAFTLPK